MDSTKFSIDLVDALSGPATRMDGALEKVERGLKDLDAPLKRLDAGLGTIASKFDAVDRRLEAMTRLMAGGTAATNRLGEAQLRAMAQLEINSRRAHNELVQVVRDLGSATNAAQKLKSTIGGGGSDRTDQLFAGLIGGGFGGIGGAVGGYLGGPLGAAMGSALGGITEKLASISSGFATAGLSAARFAIDTDSSAKAIQRSLGIQFGSAQAGVSFADTGRFAEQFGMRRGDVQTRLQALANRGLGVRESFTTLQGLGDLQAAGVPGTDDILNAMLQIKSKASLSMEELNQQLGEKLNVGGLLSAIGQRAGVGGDRAGVERLRKLITAGKVSGSVGFEGVLDYIQKTYSGGSLGTAAASAARTIPRLEALLTDRPTALLQAANLTGAMDAYQRFLDKLVTATDPDGPAGKRIIAMLDRLGGAVERIFSKYDGADGMKLFENDLNRVLGLLDRIVAVMEKGITAAGWALDAGVTVAGAATAPGPGPLSSMLAPLPGVGPVAGLVSSALGWLTEPHAEGGLVTRPHLGLVGEAGPELIIPLAKVGDVLGGMGGTQIHAPIELHVHNAGGDNEGLREVVRSAIASVFDEIAAREGA